MAKRLAALGMNLHLIDRDGEALDRAVGELAFPRGGLVTTWALNVANPAAFDPVQAAIAANGEPIGLLMNNAGIGGGGDALAPRDRWDRV
ncbi:SDR family NAD(P)-dependent oxidoreductase, partial [Acinetobacter baumannii]